MKVLDFTVSLGKTLPANQEEKNSEESEIAALIHVEAVPCSFAPGHVRLEYCGRQMQVISHCLYIEDQKKKKKQPKTSF